MTATMDPALATPEVDAAAARVAALEHLPTEPALELVHIVGGHVAASVLRDLALGSRELVQRLDGAHRVVRATTLLEAARRLDQDATDLEREVGARPAAVDPRDVELARLRAQHTALVEELVRRRLLCSGIGEHPPTPKQAEQVAADTRAYWTAYGQDGDV